jgi:hypothetical protein
MLLISLLSLVGATSFLISGSLLVVLSLGITLFSVEVASECLELLEGNFLIEM